MRDNSLLPALETPIGAAGPLSWLVGEVDVRLAVQQVPQVHSGALQVDGVDLEVAPVERAVGL
jgi:hypothetical protein